MGRIDEYPETPSRIQSILEALKSHSMDTIAPQDHGLSPILAIHTKVYVDYLREAYAEWIKRGGDVNGVIPDTFACRLETIYQDIGMRSPNVFTKLGMFAFDTAAVIAENTFEAAYEAAQVAVTAALKLLDRQSAFALCRPPGHHSGSQMAGGFCFFNNAAIAAQQLINNTGKRVAILDVDYQYF